MVEVFYFLAKSILKLHDALATGHILTAIRKLFAKNLKRIRNRKGLTQEQLAEKLGITPPLYSAIRRDQMSKRENRNYCSDFKNPRSETERFL